MQFKGSFDAVLGMRNTLHPVATVVLEERAVVSFEWYTTIFKRCMIILHQVNMSYHVSETIDNMSTHNIGLMVPKVALRNI